MGRPQLFVADDAVGSISLDPSLTDSHRPKQNSESAPQQMQPVYDEITRLTDGVCRDHVDEEFAQRQNWASASA